MQKPRERVDFHIKIRPKLKALFIAKTKEMGFSTCFITETLFQAWLAAAPRTSVLHPSSTITINQKIEYVVDRPRRKKRFTTPMENCYLNGIWTYRKPETGEKLSKLGHVSECVCSVCKPFESPKKLKPSKSLTLEY